MGYGSQHYILYLPVSLRGGTTKQSVPCARRARDVPAQDCPKGPKGPEGMPSADAVGRYLWYFGRRASFLVMTVILILSLPHQADFHFLESKHKLNITP